MGALYSEDRDRLKTARNLKRAAFQAGFRTA
ncbi:hypothetical protein OA2633_11620 [Oceanicaulis alexandrii HTCC2633]|nr:hypothetical protein OA2633_11620 [Oceanicaulis alexandrii HTCC2633] [Oceanicaulis sp. HTCC2633]